MSKLSGHWKITKQAVQELKNTANATIYGGQNAIALSRLHSADLANAVIHRDLADIVNLGHWGDYGQSHHFMRKFNGQSQFEAYQDGVNWIKKNALIASKRLFNVLIDSQESISKSQKPSFWVLELGYACHAMQDSFAEGHARREKSLSPHAPGRITRVLKYAGKDKEGHSEYDKHWRSADSEIGQFSLKGRLAVNATKEIISMVILTAIEQVKSGSPPVSLSGWTAFKNRWLVASPFLSKKRDAVIDMINDYQLLGIQHGNRNFLTLSMDEVGLAKSILKTYGNNTSMVYKIFARLKDKFSSDSDDILMYYLGEIKKRGGGRILYEIKNDTKLIRLFSAILTTGWSTEKEKKALIYLKRGYY